MENLWIYPEDEESVAEAAAYHIERAAWEAVSLRGGRFIFAVSGGKTPWLVLQHLARNKNMPWSAVELFQVDERVAPPGDPDRNLTHLQAALKDAPLPPEQIHPMPVEEADLEAAAASYSDTLRKYAGRPAVFDLIHLGLGPDGHTASLVPGDAVLEVTDRDVAITGVYQGRSRMTLTYPVLNRARRLLWLVTGASKAEALRRFFDGDQSIPAGRVSKAHACGVADQAAAGKGPH